MPALEPVDAVRVVASPAALDAARWIGEDVDVLRIAADEALGIGATGAEVGEAEAIVESEAGFAVALLDDADVAALAAHTDWVIRAVPGTVAQGKIAGVPAKVLVGQPTLLVTNAAYADELRSRLGWD